MIVERARIEEVLGGLDLVPLIEDAFRGYSAGRAVVPPVGELLLDKGEVHIKYGAIRGDDYYVVKIASGFYGNAALGLPSSNGLMLVFRQETGEPEAALLDEGYLTDVRTAVAGAVGARALARPDVGRIGVLGVGMQARLQVQHLAPLFETREVVAWGREPGNVEAYVRDMAAAGFRVEAASEPRDVAAVADLIVTTTPATGPLLTARRYPPGHSYHRHRLRHHREAGARRRRAGQGRRRRGRQPGAVPHSGRDLPGRGRRRHRRSKAIELGSLLSGDAVGRTSAEQITVFDSTGVAVQDIAIATAVVDAVAE